MPLTPADYTTAQLLDQADGTSFTTFTVAQIVAELKLRKVPNDYEDEAMRGGLFPTRPGL